MGSGPSLSFGWRVPRPPAWALVLLVSWSCVAAPPRRPDLASRIATATEEPQPSTPNGAASAPGASAVVLVVLDGVRWQEVFEGVDPDIAHRQGLAPEEIVGARALMPTLHDVLIGHGVAVGAPGEGPEMRATGPNYVSLPGYTEILTGRTATRCHDNSCAQVVDPTFADELAIRERARPGEQAAVIASWESLERAASSGSGDVVVSAGRHGGHHLDILRSDERENALYDEASRATSTPGEADFRPDHFTSDIALRYLVAHEPRFLFIGLGEPDEYAHQDNYRGYLESLRAADRTLARLVDALGRMGERGRRTSVLVTTDHGRSNAFRDHGGFAPESGRVWLVASGSGIADKGLLRSYEPHRLADIAPTMRALLGVAPDVREDAGRVIREALSL
jgi:Metalloenzyme superfamily